jgi:malonate decarboxylase gamma subunit
LQEVLDKVFDTSKTSIANNVVAGVGNIKGTKFHIIGTVENTPFGVDEALEMAKHVLNVVRSNDLAPILLLVDVDGQKLSKRDEWLGMYAYFAHLLKCLHLAREQGNVLISLIYNQAIGGSFIAFGMMADRIYALSHAKLAVMWLEGMAKVTKLDIEMLRKISETSPVFAPGVENFKKLGGLHEVLTLDHVSDKLLQTLTEKSLATDNRAELGKKLGGRTKAYDIITKIESL